MIVLKARRCRLAQWLLVLMTPLTLSACGSLTGPRENFTVYTLNPAIATHSPATVADWQLLIDTPKANDLLDGQRIVVAPDSNQRQVYRGARWAERAPVLIQSVWLHGFESDGRVASVGRNGSGLRADIILASDLTDFQARYVDGLPVVEIGIHAQLIDPRDRRIRAGQRFSASRPAASTEIAEVVAAFEQALAGLTAELIAWTIEQGNAARQSVAAGSP